MASGQYQYGVLLLNMGGPSSLDEVEDYIFQLLADPDMVRLPLAPLLQKPFARLVARRRAPRVRERYKLIGGESPIEEATMRQAKALSAVLEMPVGYAMRYTPPYAEQAATALSHLGATRLVAIPLYPQYSTVSTLSALKDLSQRVNGQIDYRVIDRHYNDPGYIDAMQWELNQRLAEVEPELKTHLLFAAHSIPEAYIGRGDPYADEVEQTMHLICSKFGEKWPFSLAYQSQVGPVKWRGPTLDEELARLLANGVEQLVVQPLSFVCENLETLYDLDIVFRGSCERAGIKSFLRVPALGDSPRYIEALAALARRRLAEWEAEDA